MILTGVWYNAQPTIPPQPALVMEVDTGLAPNALCAYERTARAAGNAIILIQKIKFKSQK